MAPDHPTADTTPLDDAVLAQQEALDLPNREAMTLIEPGLGLVEGNIFQPTGTDYDPTATDPNDATTDQNLGMPADTFPSTLA